MRGGRRVGSGWAAGIPPSVRPPVRTPARQVLLFAAVAVAEARYL